ncbi:MAG: Spy/CpxP family protein refolding chaperone [Deltaproteobacteria bacterium]|nr:Spy/CpxP family protein refolding chaperone [Deltaproteobacteria bacterium]
MNKTVILLCIAFLAALMPAHAGADPENRRMAAEPRYGHAFDKWISENLNLTVEQTADIRSLRQEHLTSSEPLLKRLYLKRRELRHLWLQHPPDRSRITAVDDEIRILRAQLDDQMTGHRQAILKVLTPEQQAKLENYRPGHGRGAGMGRRTGMRGY